MLCVLMKILSHASAKKKRKRPTGFKFRVYIAGSFSIDIMAVKGLIVHSTTETTHGSLPQRKLVNRNWALGGQCVLELST